MCAEPGTARMLVGLFLVTHPNTEEENIDWYGGIVYSNCPCCAIYLRRYSWNCCRVRNTHMVVSLDHASALLLGKVERYHRRGCEKCMILQNAPAISKSNISIHTTWFTRTPSASAIERCPTGLAGGLTPEGP
jgi:hypothetical protein